MKLNTLFLAFLSLFAPLLHAIPKHTGPPFDAKPRNALVNYAEALADQYQLKLLLAGLGCIVDSKGLWAVHFTSSDKMEIDKGRCLAKQIAQDLIGFMYENPLFTDYFKYERTTSCLSVNEMGYKIAFWDENVNRPLYPFLAEIRLRDGELYFYYADPKTQALQAPHIESFVPGA